MKKNMFKKIDTPPTDDEIADAFYDEDWDWFKKHLGFKPKNHADAEKRIEMWKIDNFG